MARLTYSAPGVYVEEIPSAQQPIAGVGTSTAAFIGVISDDDIEYPVRNEDYNPKAAQIAFKIDAFKKAKGLNLEDATDQEKAYLKTVTDKLKGSGGGVSTQPRNLDGLIAAEKTAHSDYDAAVAASSQAPSDANKKKEGEKKEAWEKAKQKLEDAQKQPTPSASSAPAVADVLKPYILKTFKVEVDPCETRLCTNFTEYTNYFGSFSADDPKYSGHRALTHAVYGFFLNGGMRCFVARVKSPEELPKALKMVESIDEVALVAAPGLDNKSKACWSDVVN
ncbi:MAG: hypothetical protein WAW61_06365, partial [Methylococcaceae bacterium]